MNQTWLKLLKFIAFLVFVYLVIYGQATVGRKYLLIQLECRVHLARMQKYQAC